MYIDEFMEGLDDPLFCLEEIIEKKKLDYKHWGLPVIEFADKQHAVALNADLANEAAGKSIKESLWTFSAYTIANYTDLNLSVSSIEKILELCKEANEIIAAIIIDVEEFIEDAISDKGRGLFLAIYDNEEIELYFGNETIYLYRLE